MGTGDIVRLFKIERKVSEEDIIGLIKTELPYNSVEIKKRGSKLDYWNERK